MVLKQFVISLLIISLGFNIGSGLIMNAWYKWANTSFEKTFCVNIDEPEKKCHGSCKMKMINKAPKEKNDLDPFLFIFKGECSTFLIPDLPIKKLSISELDSKKLFLYFFDYTFNNIVECDHPPELL